LAGCIDDELRLPGPLHSSPIQPSRSALRVYVGGTFEVRVAYWRSGADDIEIRPPATAQPPTRPPQAASFSSNPRLRSIGSTAGSRPRKAAQAATGASTQAYSYDELGQFTGDGSNSYTHAFDGAMMSDGTGWTFQYDYLRRKTRAQKPMDITVTYLTNGLGQRVRKEVNKYFPGGTPTAAPAPAATAGSETSLIGGPKVISAPLAPTWRITSNRQFFYDDGGRLLGEYDSASGVGAQETVWFNGQPVAMQQGGVLYRVHADHLATPRSITRASDNAEVWRWDSDAFGNGAPITMGGGATVIYHPRFPGQYLDTETGLHYNMARYYDPVTGRYTQADPIGLSGGVARYTYVSGDPMSLVDPEGQKAQRGGNSGQRRIEQRAADRAESQRIERYYERVDRTEQLFRPYRESYGFYGGAADLAGAFTGAGAETRSSGVPNAVESLMSPRTKDAFLSVLPAISAPNQYSCPK
jgi:RHS repeat-associated protein